MTQLHISISTISNGVLVHVGSPYAETSVLAYGSKGQEPTHYPTMDGALAALPQLAADALVEEEDRRKAMEQEKARHHERARAVDAGGAWLSRERIPTCGENDVIRHGPFRDEMIRGAAVRVEGFAPDETEQAFGDERTETNTFNAEANSASLRSDLSEPKGPFPPEEPYPGEDDGA